MRSAEEACWREERRSEEVFGLYLGVWVIGRFHFVEFISVGLSFLRNGIITPFIRVCSFYFIFFIIIIALFIYYYYFHFDHNMDMI
jgi:hypothetical protein